MNDPRPSVVLTVTLNPAVDVSFEVDHVLPDHKLRGHGVRREPGGGGVNVARVLERLEIGVTPFVVAGGATGAELIRLITCEDLEPVVFEIEDQTRLSITPTDRSTGAQYRFVLPGPPIDDPAGLRASISEAASRAALVVLSGSLPPGLDATFADALLAELTPSVPVIVDTAGPGLEAAARSAATLVKPSQRELTDLVGWQPSTPAEIERAAREALERGEVGAIVASRGPSGALLVRRDQPAIWFHPPPVTPVSAVGAGDSMVAGIAASLVRGDSVEDAVRFGVAAGTAAVISPGSELCNPRDIQSLLQDVTADTRAAGS